MMQIARNVTMADWGFLIPGHYLIHDRDAKLCPAFQHTIDCSGSSVCRSLREPNLNAYAERWLRSVKEEVLSRLILFGEGSLRHALSAYTAHYHQERPHQGKGNVVLMPAPDHMPKHGSPIRCQERLGGLLTYYYREAA